MRSLATQVLVILSYLHGLNLPVFHRDIKPSNLILGKDKRVYLVDFGAVQDRAAVEGVTFTVVGTTGYAPLEQFWGKAVEASDLYALGATLIHLLTGVPPADLPQRNLRIQFKEQVSINPAFLSWIEALTEPDLNLRFSTASQALEALQTGRFITYPLQPVHPPFRTRIQVKKSPNQLIIKIPVRGILVLGDFIVWLVKLILRLSFSISLAGLPFTIIVLPLIMFRIIITLIIAGSEFVFWQVYFVLVAYVILTDLLCKLLKAVHKELDQIIYELNSTQMPAFGKCIIEFDRNKFVIERRVVSFCYFRQCARISDILEIFSSKNFKTVFILSPINRYFLGKTSSQAEGKWLVREIQEWLAER